MLLELPNLKRQEIPNAYVHLKDLQIHNHDPKNKLPVHVIGVVTKQKIITQERPRVGLSGEPIAELTKFCGLLFFLDKKLQICYFSKHPYMIMKNFLA